MNDISQRVVDAARTCIGTPFYHQGRVAGMGLDCIGLVIHAIRQAGITVTDCLDYGRQPQGEKLHDALIAHEFEMVEGILPGDVVLFRFQGQPQHVGLAVSSVAMVHSYAPIGKVVEARLGETWQRRIAGIYRHPSLCQDS